MHTEIAPNFWFLKTSHTRKCLEIWLFSCWLEILNFHVSSTLIISPISVTGRKSNFLSFSGMGVLKKSKVRYINCMQVKFQFLQTKWLEMEAKTVFEQYFLNILYVFSKKYLKLTNLKPYEKPTWKFVFQICNHHRSKWPSFSEKRTPIVLSDCNV